MKEKHDAVGKKTFQRLLRWKEWQRGACILKAVLGAQTYKECKYGIEMGRIEY